jgi:SAM-dependent methyltransferase
VESKSDISENAYKDLLFAQFYDFIVERLGRRGTHSEIINNIVEQFGAPILEMGCGTGGQLLPLAERGYSVTGIDYSSAMLRVFEQKLSNVAPGVRDNVRLIVGDMTSPSINQSDFRLILFSASQFLHLNNDEQRLACLKNSCNLLAEDGVVFISNAKLTKEPHSWENCSQPDDTWILEVRSKREGDVYQEDFKLTPKSLDQQEVLFEPGWRLYCVEDIHMKGLIERAGLRCIPLSPDWPTISTSNFYLCKKNV